MKAAALVEPERIEAIDLPEPDCGADEVVVRMLGAGLCGTDVGVFRGHRPAPRLPWVLGHEGVGEIVAVGGAVGDRVTGQRVAIEPNYCCLRCRPCRQGLTSGCEHRVAVGLATPGVLAEYVAVPAAFAHPVAGHVELPDLVCAEPLTVARAGIRRSGVTEGQRCLVVGAGSQGLLMCAALAAAGVTPFVREPHPGRLDLALSLGALEFDGAQVDHVFETSGVPAALVDALEALGTGGRATVIGISPEPFALTMRALVYRQLSVTGSLIYDHPHDFADTITLLEKGDLAPHRVLRAEFPLAGAAEAFGSVSSTAGKSWIRLDEGAS